MQVLLHCRPLLREHAVHHGVPDAAVASRHVMADHAVLLRAQRLDGLLRAEVEVVGAKADHLAIDCFKTMRKQKQLAGGIYVAALTALGIPRVADLHAIRRCDDVVIARAADDLAAPQVSHRPGQHLASLLAFQCIFDVFFCIFRLWNRRKEKLPQPAVLSRFGESFFVLARKRLQPHAVAFQRGGYHLDQAAPLSRPSFLNMSRMPRAAWRRRCSFSISAMRTWS